MTEGEQGGAEGDERRPHPFYNWLSLAGLALAACNVTALAFFVLVGIFARESGYGGLTLLPLVGGGLLGLGLAAGRLHPGTMAAEARAAFELSWELGAPSSRLRPRNRSRRGHPGAHDRDPGPARGGCSFFALTEYSESNAFCGQTCHQVMSPEATVYENSPHSRIACVECHVGPGTDSYVRAKIGGLRQLLAVATGNIERPIHTPIRNRRPSREMCESCHTPDRFVGFKTASHSYYLSGRRAARWSC